MSRYHSNKVPSLPTQIRDLAFDALTRTERAEKNLSSALDDIFSSMRGLSPSQRAMVSELAYGTTRHRRLLDRALSERSRRSLKALHPGLHRALRLAAYQILLMDNANRALAVDHAVSLARRIVGKGGAGYANAMLRRMADDPRLPEVTRLRDRIAVSQSFPDWIADIMIQRLGPDEAIQLAEALNERPAQHLRANRQQISRDELVERLRQAGIDAQAGRWSDDALVLRGLADPVRHPLYAEGLYEVQDEASQLLAPMLDARAGERILDACCGNGGKTMHMVSLGLDKGLLVGADNDRPRLRQARNRAGRTASSVQWLLTDLTQPALRPASFHRVLLDAPCTGLGTLRRHPEAKWRLRKATLRSAVQLQRSLLDHVSTLVRPGGMLLYVVCTFTNEEGPDQVRWFLERHPEFLHRPLTGVVPADLIDDQGNLSTWPHRHGIDGFFAAAFERSQTS